MPPACCWVSGLSTSLLSCCFSQKRPEDISDELEDELNDIEDAWMRACGRAIEAKRHAEEQLDYLKRLNVSHMAGTEEFVEKVKMAERDYEALMAQADLKCLEVEECVEELLTVHVPRTIKIAIDSGAGDHVAGRGLVGDRRVRPSRGSRSGRHFIAANGDKIANQGEADLHMVEPRGGGIRSVFQVADVTRALYSVSKMCDDGCEVHFDKDKGVVTRNGRHVATFIREGGLYTIEMAIKGDDEEEIGSRFTRPGAKA